jgi:hypothetical protein
MEDDFKKWKTTSAKIQKITNSKRMEDNLKKNEKMEGDLKKWKTTSKKLEDDLKKTGRRPEKNNRRQPQAQLK